MKKIIIKCLSLILICAISINNYGINKILADIKVSNENITLFDTGIMVHQEIRYAQNGNDSLIFIGKSYNNNIMTVYFTTDGKDFLKYDFVSLAKKALSKSSIDINYLNVSNIIWNGKEYVIYGVLTDEEMGESEAFITTTADGENFMLYEVGQKGNDIGFDGKNYIIYHSDDYSYTKVNNYYTSTDLKKWTKRKTYSNPYKTGWEVLNISSNGIIFGAYDDDSEAYSEYYLTKDFKTYNEINGLSADVDEIKYIDNNYYAIEFSNNIITVKRAVNSTNFRPLEIVEVISEESVLYYTDSNVALVLFAQTSSDNVKISVFEDGEAYNHINTNLFNVKNILCSNKISISKDKYIGMHYIGDYNPNDIMEVYDYNSQCVSEIYKFNEDYDKVTSIKMRGIAKTIIKFKDVLLITRLNSSIVRVEM